MAGKMEMEMKAKCKSTNLFRKSPLPLVSRAARSADLAGNVVASEAKEASIEKLNH